MYKEKIQVKNDSALLMYKYKTVKYDKAKYCKVFSVKAILCTCTVVWQVASTIAYTLQNDVVG